MITREILKAEIDQVGEEYIEILYKIIKAFKQPAEKVLSQCDAAALAKGLAESDWSQFIKETYGSMADSPIERGEQGVYEIRESFDADDAGASFV